MERSWFNKRGYYVLAVVLILSLSFVVAESKINKVKLDFNDTSGSGAFGTVEIMSLETPFGVYNFDAKIKIENASHVDGKVYELWLYDLDSDYALSLGAMPSFNKKIEEIDDEKPHSLRDRRQRHTKREVKHEDKEPDKIIFKFKQNQVNSRIYDKVFITLEDVNDTNPRMGDVVLEADIPGSLRSAPLPFYPVEIRYFNVVPAIGYSIASGIEDATGLVGVTYKLGNWSAASERVGFRSVNGTWINETLPYDWREIRDVGTPVTLADDDFSVAIPMPFNVSFIGNESRDSFLIISNGYITFDTSSVRDGCCNGVVLPTSLEPNDIVAGYWSDLNPEDGGNIYYYLTGSVPHRQMIIEFDHIPHYSDAFLQETFQIVLNERV